VSRQVRDSRLETKAARERLGSRKTYWKTILPNLVALGYRRSPGLPGVWLVRRYVGKNGKGGGKYQIQRLGLADDYAEANGETVLTYGEAQLRAQRKEGPRSPLTVARAMENYIAGLREDGKPTYNTELATKSLICPAFGDVLVEQLTAGQIRAWRAAYAAKAPWRRVKKGEAHSTTPAPKDEETSRRRRASANRVTTILKAGLNRAFLDGEVGSDVEWRRVTPYKKVDHVRLRYLSTEEAIRIINACDPNFRSLVRAGLETGARYGELTGLKVRDFNADSGTLFIAKSKSGKTRDIILTPEGTDFFFSLTNGRDADEPMFLKDGRRWHKGEQVRPFREAVARAGITPADFGFHNLRHTWASLSVMGGVPLKIVAENLGHASVKMTEKYAHLAKDYKVAAIHAKAPRFLLAEPRGNVRSLRLRRT
jgi:integrase